MSGSGVQYTQPTWLIEAGDMSGNLTSSEYPSRMLNDVSIFYSWSGSSPVGELFVEVKGPDGNWWPLKFTTTLAITGATGFQDINLRGAIPEFRVRYAATSGTGTLKVWFCGKDW